MQIRGNIQNLVCWLLVLAFVGIVGMTGAAKAAQPPGAFAQPPDHAGKQSNCGNCHFSRDPRALKPSQLYARNHSKLPARMTGQERLCQECHTGVVEASHPTGIVPSRSLPSQFPLNAQGEMTCSTCHAVEEGGQVRKDPAQSNRDFCESCHAASFFSGMADGGGSIPASGHLGVDKGPSGAADSYSMQCMTCHIDNASIAGIRTASIGAFAPNGGAAGHSIGATYGNFSARRTYNPASALDPQILLPEGRVSCLSCHKAYTEEHGKLTVARNLCAQCHNK